MKKILWLSFILALAAYINTALRDPDLWWHIVVGRWIVAQGTVPVVDHWSLLGQGLPWRAYSWLVEVLMAFVDRLGGVKGLVIFQFSLAALVATSYAFVLGRISKDYLFGAILALLAFASTYGHFALRPQTFTWAYLACTIFLAQQISERGLNRNNKLQIFILMVLWANTHFSAVLGLAVLALWSFERSKWQLSLQALLWGLAGTFVTPYFGGEWLTFLETTSHPLLYNAVQEFEPARALERVTAFIWILLTMALVLRHEGAALPAPGRLLLAALFVLGGLFVKKFLPISILILAANVALMWRSIYLSQDRRGFSLGIEKVRGLVEWVPKEGLSFCLIAFAIMRLSTPLYMPVAKEFAPVSAMNEILGKNYPRPLANLFGDGGYIMYRQSDDNGYLSNPVFIDGRTNLIPTDFWHSFYAALQGHENWGSFLEGHKVKSILWQRDFPLNAILMAGSNWCRTYQDGKPDHGNVIFVEREAWLQTDLPAVNCQR